MLRAGLGLPEVSILSGKSREGAVLRAGLGRSILKRPGLARGFESLSTESEPLFWHRGRYDVT